MKYIANNNASKGYTLIELSIAVAVLGLMMVVLFRFGMTSAQRVAQIEQPNLLNAADQALVGFAAANHRLPCPDLNNDGQEDIITTKNSQTTADYTGRCGLNDPVNGGPFIDTTTQTPILPFKGLLPYVTLGLARADMQQVQYGVFLKSNIDPEADVSLNLSLDRLYPLLPTAIPSAPKFSTVAVTSRLAEKNGIDFCHALRLGAALPRDSSTEITSLYILKPPVAEEMPTTPLKNVAYALSITDPLSDVQRNGNSNGAAFASPTQVSSNSYRDNVIAVDFSQLFNRLSCASVMTTSSHAHPNLALSGSIITGAVFDYKVQLDLQLELAKLGELSAGVGIAGATGDVASAVSEVATGISETISSFGGMSAGIALAATSTALSAVALGFAIAGQVSAAATTGIAQARVDEFAATPGQAKALAQGILDHAKAVDAAGIYR
jgi:prepilin-type N-terminal cleavage/methylation domain-containing protein